MKLGRLDRRIQIFTLILAGLLILVPSAGAGEDSRIDELEKEIAELKALVAASSDGRMEEMERRLIQLAEQVADLLARGQVPGLDAHELLQLDERLLELAGREVLGHRVLELPAALGFLAHVSLRVLYAYPNLARLRKCLECRAGFPP